MVEDLVINTYKEQIKESLLKAKAIELAGFQVIISELNRRLVDTSRIEEYFNKIKAASTRDDLNRLKLDELNYILEQLNDEVRKRLISKADMSDLIIRKSRIIASEMSIDKKILEDDKFIKIGNNLASEVNSKGIIHGIDICIKNYTIQKLYQKNYEEKIREKESELGISNENIENNSSINTTSTQNMENTKKSKFLYEIYNENIEDVSEDFKNVKDKFMSNIINKDLSSKIYKNLVSKYYDLSTEEKKEALFNELNSLCKVINIVSKNNNVDNVLSYNPENMDNEDENLTKVYNNIIIIEEKLVNFLKNIGY